MAKKGSQQSSGSVRIIGGKWRSRNLRFVSVDGLRPTGSRIRETLFNWLAPTIEGARCLDLFTGSGALCFEAISRGADCCLAIEANSQAVSELRHNQAQLTANNLEIVSGDCQKLLERGNTAKPYDIIFLDPPFDMQLHKQVSRLLISGNWLASKAQIYCEFPATEAQDLPLSWRLIKDKIAGNVRYCLFEYVEQTA
ncbi:16S rRNA (guanine(966)-N(2))-methyltransferase RsmD [Porticoccaceae bacterium]|nr:16S rRNA (guanine(966)-N(2))-methyltransferase RsmD [Porticoccaceae bacterium]